MNPVRNYDKAGSKRDISNGVNRPLPCAFILFIAGILSAHHISISLVLPMRALAGFTTAIVLAAAILIILTFVCICRGGLNLPYYIWASCLVFILGAAAYINFNRLSDHHIAHLLEAQPKGRALKGVIVSSPDYFRTHWGKRKTSFLFKVLSYKQDDSWIKTDGISKVTVEDCRATYFYGNTLVVMGRVKAPPEAAGPGEFDYANYLSRRRIYTLINIRSDDDIVRLVGEPSFSPKRFIFRVRERIESLIRAYLPRQDAAVLSAVLLGKRTDIPKWLKERFIRSGTAHILSVSGLHITILSAILFFILLNTGVPRKPSSIIVIGFLAVYAVFAGARIPIIRATIMIAVYLLAYLLERDFDIYSALSLAGIIILLMSPMQVFDAGFCLSFACVFSICYLTPKIESIFTALGISSALSSGIRKPRLSKERIGKTGLSYKLLRYTIGLASASVAVYIGVMPLVAYYFHIVAPVTLIANLLVVPFLGVVMFSGTMFVILSFLIGPIAPFLSSLMHIILSGYVNLILFFSNLPFGHFYILDIPLYSIVVYYVLVLLVVERKNLRLRSP